MQLLKSSDRSKTVVIFVVLWIFDVIELPKDLETT